jgi:enoyl-CoA hydratase/carnithine racemase
VTSLSPLRVERDGGVAILTLDRPEVLNAFNEALTEALNAAIADCAADAAVRAVVITGNGRAFSAGQDLADRLAMIERGGDLHLGDELRRRYHPAIAAIRTMRKPVIAAVNGVAAGAGLGVAIACDIRVAAESASFRAAWSRVGLVPDAGSAFFLPRRRCATDRAGDARVAGCGICLGVARTRSGPRTRSDGGVRAEQGGAERGDGARVRRIPGSRIGAAGPRGPHARLR